MTISRQNLGSPGRLTTVSPRYRGEPYIQAAWRRAERRPHLGRGAGPTMQMPTAPSAVEQRLQALLARCILGLAADATVLVTESHFASRFWRYRGCPP